MRSFLKRAFLGGKSTLSQMNLYERAKQFCYPPERIQEIVHRNGLLDIMTCGSAWLNILT